jgi:hypothetical protein
MDGDAPAILLRDRDDNFGSAFDRAAQGVGTKVIRMAVRAPNMRRSPRDPAVAHSRVLGEIAIIDNGRPTAIPGLCCI